MSSQARRKVKLYKGVGFLIIEGNLGKKGLPLSVPNKDNIVSENLLIRFGKENLPCL